MPTSVADQLVDHQYRVLDRDTGVVGQHAPDQLTDAPRRGTVQITDDSTRVRLTTRNTLRLSSHRPPCTS